MVFGAVTRDVKQVFDTNLILFNVNVSMFCARCCLNHSRRMEGKYRELLAEKKDFIAASAILVTWDQRENGGAVFDEHCAVFAK